MSKRPSIDLPLTPAKTPNPISPISSPLSATVTHAFSTPSLPRSIPNILRRNRPLPSSQVSSPPKMSLSFTAVTSHSIPPRDFSLSSLQVSDSVVQASPTMINSHVQTSPRVTARYVQTDSIVQNSPKATVSLRSSHANTQLTFPPDVNIQEEMLASAIDTLSSSLPSDPARSQHLKHCNKSRQLIHNQLGFFGSKYTVTTAARLVSHCNQISYPTVMAISKLPRSPLSSPSCKMIVKIDKKLLLEMFKDKFQPETIDQVL